MVAAVVEILSWASIVGYAALCFRLWRDGLDRTYRWFTAYLLFDAARSIGLKVIPYNTNLYFWVWATSELFLDILYILVVLELVSLILGKFRGIASLGRWAVFAALMLGVFIASVSLSPDLSNPTEQYPLLRYFFVLQRGINSSLVLFLLFMTLFLVWYPVPLSRNLVVYSAIYFVYFLCISLAFLVRNLAGHPVTQLVNLALSATNVACVVAWLALLTRAGEQRAVTVRQRWNAAEQQHLIDQLAAINASLLRTARK